MQLAFKGAQCDDGQVLTRHKVFVGCFHRGGEQELGLKLFSFLNDNSLSNDDRDEAAWKPRITLSSVQSLVSTAQLNTAEFLASKISLRCRIFSLYAGYSQRRIHPVIRPSLSLIDPVKPKH